MARKKQPEAGARKAARKRAGSNVRRQQPDMTRPEANKRESAPDFWQGQPGDIPRERYPDAPYGSYQGL